MASSVPAQVMYPPPPSFGSGHSHNPHPPPPHPPQTSHYGAAHPQVSSSSSYHPQSVHHPHHATSLPPPPPPPVRQQHYQGYSAQYGSHSSQHHEHQYPQERLPSIRDLDFQFHQQQQSAQAQSQQQQQGQSQQQQSQQQQSQQQQHPTQQQTQLQQSAGSVATGPSASGSGSGGGSTVSPASLVITPSRQRRAWGTPPGPVPSSSATGPSQPQLYAHHHLPPPTQPQPLSHSHSHSQVTPIPSGSASASASSSSFTAGPSASLPTGQTTQYHASSPLARRHRSESLISGGGRGSVGSIGSTSSLGGMSGGPATGSTGAGQSAGQAGGMSMPSASSVTRSPLVSSAYGHNTGTSTGYAHPLPPAAMGATPLASTSTMSGTGTIGPPSNATSSSAAGGNPHSPYGTAFPSPHTPHHHLHTPLSQSHVPPGASGTGAAGGAQLYARQEYGEYDYSAGYGTPAATGPPSSTAPPAQSEPHAYGGRGMPQTQILYGPPPQSHPSHHAPPPNTEPWSTPHPHQQSPLVGYQQQSGHHIPQQQQQHAAYGRSSGSSSLIGAVSGGYSSAPPLSSHPSTHQQAHGHGQLISPGADEHEVGHGPGPIGGGLPFSVAGGNAGGPYPGSTKAHFLPKVRELCYMLHEFAVRYANSASQPSQAEVEDMARRAAEVIHLLSEYKRAALAESADGGSALHHPHPYAHSHTYSQSYPGVGMGLPSPAPEEHEADRERGGMRAPKRPWEDVAQESDEDAFVPASISAPVPKFGGGSARESIPKQESISTGPMVAGAPMMGGIGRGVDTDMDRTAAEKDMALIRSKRATNVGILGPGVPKGKYRKRSRATPPGKCHSCNIRETPEWRRGPDGARTLCNACGLHYAKLIRKRDKQAAASTDGSQTRIEIDMETLRASTRAASEREQLKAERERERREREKAGFTEKSEDGGEQGGIGMEFELGLGLETGSNDISSGNEAGDNAAGMERKGNGNEVGMIAPAPAPTTMSSNGSNSSNELLDNWRTYTEADISQTSSFLRGSGAPGIAPATVRSASS